MMSVKLVLLGTSIVVAALWLCSTASAQDGDPSSPAVSDASGHEGHSSLIDAAPALYYELKRYPKFFGDPNLDTDTVDGDLFDRQYLLGSLDGFRTDLAEGGLFVDLGLTQVLQNVVSGDSDDDTNYTGSADLWVGLDTGRAGLWPDGIIYTHLEGNWGTPVSGSGALLPTSFDASMPGEPDAFALSEAYLVQALSAEITVVMGKAAWSAFADTSFFANNERTQFLNTGLVNNPLLGTFVPYTDWGVFGLAQVSKEWQLAAAILQNSGSAEVSGFDDFRADELTYVAAAVFDPKIADELPGSYQLLLFYTAKDADDFAIDRRYFLEQIAGLVPRATKDDNYALTFTASQYLWLDKGAQRRDGAPVGFGPFLRFGIAPDDRNVIDQFYSVGIGGNGGLFGRVNDNWGVGWAGSHISSDVRELAINDLNDFEHTVEAFYGFQITPAAHLTLDLQYIDPVRASRDDIVLLGTRLQLDF